jgi:hypothetical protein
MATLAAAARNLAAAAHNLVSMLSPGLPHYYMNEYDEWRLLHTVWTLFRSDDDK